ncbi:MAG: UbiA family prenyltransferase [Niabella sp.]
MKWPKAIRTNDWWEVKLSPLLAIGYATTLLYGQDIFNHAITYLLTLISVAAGAVYVSIVNDIADIEQDRLAGKANRMAKIRPTRRWMMPLLCIAAGVAFICFVYYPDKLSVFLYLMPWVAFSLYSFKPVRLKSRGLWGVLADASGSHVFISLLMVSFISFKSGHDVDWLWFAVVGAWALCYGIRGILWHQFYDRDNDLRSNEKTFATTIKPEKIKGWGVLVFTIEMIATVSMLLLLSNTMAYMALVCYFLLVLMRHYFHSSSPVIIRVPDSDNWFIWMLDFWQALFPLALLLSAASSQSNAWVILAAHIILFPVTITRITKEAMKFFLRLLKTKP